MVMKRREGDLCTAYRPHTFSDFVGQKAIVKSIKASVLSENHSQCYLFHGESGCGKTSMARIMAMSLNCQDRLDNGDPCCVCYSCTSISNGSHPDVHEIDSANVGGIDHVRKIQVDLNSNPMFGSIKMYIFDEAHRITSAAQNALLKVTEDMPKNIYVILCSTEPKKIIRTLRNRCEEHNYKTLSHKDITYLVDTICFFETGKQLDDIHQLILPKILEISQGRPRNAIKALQKILHLIDEDVQDMLDVLSFEDDADKTVIDLCRIISSNHKVSWSKVVEVYKKIEAEPETIRMTLAGWFRSFLEKAKSPKTEYRAVSALEYLVYDAPVSKPENKLLLNMYKVYKIYNA